MLVHRQQWIYMRESVVGVVLIVLHTYRTLAIKEIRYLKHKAIEETILTTFLEDC